MNSCILMAKIIRSPELRYTQDNQTPVAQMLVEFEGFRPEDPPATLKVVGWRDTATEIQQNYSEGDRVIIIGRLAMNTIDRQEGFKEKRAELTISQIHRVDGSITNNVSTQKSAGESSGSVPAQAQPRAATPTDSYEPSPSIDAAPAPEKVAAKKSEPVTVSPTKASEPAEPDLDDIPF